ncbi:MAG: hypothetical protein ACI8Z1_002064 [Candidatus Azotimanducaceae bacterium]|jgi:uncharacterized protein (DUF427 family)
MKAIWNDEVIAESDDTVVVEGNHYFPKASLAADLFTDNPKNTSCPWKGTANYFDITVAGQTNKAGAWCYGATTEKAKNIEGRIAFWKGVKVTD